MPSGARVAPFANREVVATERALAVMASHATLPTTGRVMVERLRSGDLSALRHSGSNLVAFVAGNFLVLRVIKTDAKCASEFRSPGITAKLVTCSA
jgi:hypothetical protein